MSTPTAADRTGTGNERTPRRLPWWAPWATAAAIAVVVVGVGSWILASQDTTGMGMAGDTSEGVPPAVNGYYQGERVGFIHTESSDAEVAQMLTDMMGGSPVIHTPALAEAGGEMVAPVYVFTNGIRPDGARGPFGYQPDIFDTVPGDQNYSALRSVHLVEWVDGSEPAELTSADELTRAEDAGDVTITTPDIVVNMPVITWPGGSR